jgi:hypothetical protein
MDLHELQMRRTVCLAALKVLQETGATPQVVRDYHAQLATLDKRIEEITGKPPPVVVGLKTASLFGKANSKGD